MSLPKFNPKGFTLTELMIVLALVAIASALVLPAIGHAYGNLELRTAASSMSSLFAQARTHSVYEARSYQVVFGPAEESARQLFLLRDDGRQIQHVTLPAHIAVLAGGTDGVWDAEVQPVHFFADGTSELLQLDLRSPRKKHVQLVLDPLTARASVTQIYNEAEQ
jgi:type II secretion system protein H